MNIPKEKLIQMYRTMLRIRHFENEVKDLFAAGELPGFVHLYLGEERKIHGKAFDRTTMGLTHSSGGMGHRTWDVQDETAGFSNN